MIGPKSPRPLLLILLAANFGCVFLARNMVGLLAPFATRDIPLDGVHLGIQAAALDMAWAVSGLVTTLYAARFLSARRLLVLLTAACAGGALLTAMAGSFVLLVAARLFAGAVSGPVLPLSQTLLAQTSLASRRGFSMGVVQSVGSSLVASIVGPPLLVAIAGSYGWRASSLACAAALLVTTLCLWSLFRSQQRDELQLPAASRRSRESPSLRTIVATRNIRVCAAISLVMVGWLVCGAAFYSSYMVTSLGYTPMHMSRLISLFGVSALAGGLLLPWLSDRHGRRCVMAPSALLGAAAPLAMAAHASPAIVLIGMLASGFAGGIFPLFMSVIPAESLARDDAAGGIGLVQAVGELVGGIAAPVAAGILGSFFGAATTMLVIACCAVAAGLMALGIVEIAPLHEPERA
jgi:predicted MFS family arabinose efflux permease